MTMHEVTGKILLDGWGGEPGPATVYVRLLDTSRIDAAARKVAEVVLYDVQLDRVHVDLDGDGRKSKGDYLNMQSYPVITRGHPNQVEVQARRIG
jgi:hypothetical protein